MAIQFGKAGAGARQMAKGRYIFVCILAAALLAIPLALLIKSTFSPSSRGLAGLIWIVLASGVALLLMKIIDKKANHFIKRAKDAERGALAEEKVALQLSGLPEGYYGFHDISFDGFNIDHVALGPGGIFVLETKSHGGTIDARDNTLLLNGKPPEKNFLNQVWSQTKSMQEYLWKMTSKELKIKPVLCFTNAYVKVRRPVKGVDVVSLKYLNTYLEHQPLRLETADMEQILGVLKFRIEKQEKPVSTA
jgi:hypothetical protein